MELGKNVGLKDGVVVGTKLGFNVVGLKVGDVVGEAVGDALNTSFVNMIFFMYALAEGYLAESKRNTKRNTKTKQNKTKRN